MRGAFLVLCTTLAPGNPPACRVVSRHVVGIWRACCRTVCLYYERIPRSNQFHSPFFSSLLSPNSAAIVRKVYLRQGTGVGALKKRFGGAYRRGAAPEVHQDAAGGLIRNILTTLDDLKITEKSGKGGRKISRTGQQALDLVAGQVARGEV